MERLKRRLNVTQTASAWLLIHLVSGIQYLRTLHDVEISNGFVPLSDKKKFNVGGTLTNSDPKAVVFSYDKDIKEFTFVEPSALADCKSGYTCTKPPGLLLKDKTVEQKTVEITGNPDGVSFFWQFPLSSTKFVEYNFSFTGDNTKNIQAGN